MFRSPYSPWANDLQKLTAFKKKNANVFIILHIGHIGRWIRTSSSWLVKRQLRSTDNIFFFILPALMHLFVFFLHNQSVCTKIEYKSPGKITHKKKIHKIFPGYLIVYVCLWFYEKRKYPSFGWRRVNICEIYIISKIDQYTQFGCSRCQWRSFHRRAKKARNKKPAPERICRRRGVRVVERMLALLVFGRLVGVAGGCI